MFSRSWHQWINGTDCDSPVVQFKTKEEIASSVKTIDMCETPKNKIDNDEKSTAFESI